MSFSIECVFSRSPIEKIWFRIGAWNFLCRLGQVCKCQKTLFWFFKKCWRRLAGLWNLKILKIPVRSSHFIPLLFNFFSWFFLYWLFMNPPRRVFWIFALGHNGFEKKNRQNGLSNTENFEKIRSHFYIPTISNANTFSEFFFLFLNYI